MTRPFRTVLSALLLAAATPAQATLFVGPGGFPTIQAAVEAARPGDFVFVLAGRYESFIVRKHLSLIARADPLNPGQRVEVVRGTGNSPTTSLLNNTAGHLRVAGFDFVQDPTRPGHNVLLFGGAASFEDCRFDGIGAGGGMLSIVDSHVTMRHCTLTSIGVGIRIADGHLELSDCAVTASPGPLLFVGHAVEAVDSTVFVSTAQLTGGDQQVMPRVGAAGSALQLVGSRAWVVDSRLRGGNATAGPGAPAIGNAFPQAVPVRIHRNVLTGGTGVNGAAPGVAGPSGAGPLVGVRTNGGAGGIRIGSGFQIDAFAEPGHVLFFFGTLELRRVFPSPLAEQPIWGLEPSGFLGLAVADAQGRAGFGIGVPFRPSLSGVGVWFRGIDVSAFPLQLSPTVGGVVR